MLLLAALTAPRLSVALTVKVYVAGVAAVPLTVQLAFTAKPLPDKLPPNRAQVSGVVPPLVAIGWLYDDPCVPAVIAPLVVTLGMGLITTLGLIELEHPAPSVTLIVGVYVVAVVGVPARLHVAPVTALQPLTPAGNPLDVQVRVPHEIALALMITEPILLLCVYGPRVVGDIVTDGIVEPPRTPIQISVWLAAGSWAFRCTRIFLVASYTISAPSTAMPDDVSPQPMPVVTS